MPLNNVVYNTPGVYIQENQAGVLPAGLATHEAVYMVGYSSKVGAPVNELTFIQSATDFETVFGDILECQSFPSVRLYFAQRSGRGLFFLNVEAAGVYPTQVEIQTALDATFSTEDAQGFLICPEFYLNTTVDADIISLHGIFEAFVADPRFYWVHIVDCEPAIATGSTFIADAQARVATLSSPLGHSWYYMPYVVDVEDNVVPLSGAIAGIAVRRFRTEGFREPPAGIRYPVRGMKSFTQNINDLIQANLNLLGINVARRVRTHGNVVWGARTLSTIPGYAQANGRVVLNVLAGTFREAFDSLIFSVVDGQGVVFSRIKSTAVAICELLRVQGALFGATPREAYRVICGLENNPGIQLDNGQVNCDVYVRVSPTLEFLGIRLNRVSLATSLDDIIEEDVPELEGEPDD